LYPYGVVDRTARNTYAQCLRHFAAGLLTNDEYEARTEELCAGSGDSALFSIWLTVWTCYSDLRTHRLRGKDSLTREGKRFVARAILFLYSEREYLWPSENISCTGTILNMVTLGMSGRVAALIVRRQMARIGDPDAWPFISQLDEAAERSRPSVLFA
jgi:hypothetical protein